MSIADEAEEYLRAVTAQPEPPRPSECLRCYVRRMVARNGCDGGHRWGPDQDSTCCAGSRTTMASVTARW